MSEKSRRELKSLYPTTGATTNYQSSLEALLLLRQSPPQAGVSVSEKLSARAEKYVPHYRGDNDFSILTGGTFTFKTVSPIIKRVELHQKSSRRKTKWFSSYFRFPTSHTTVRAVPHTAVLYLTCSMT